MLNYLDKEHHNKPILFLDIDGVLNGNDTRQTIQGVDLICKEHKNYTWLCQHRINQLNKILDAVPNTWMVLSSTWRTYGIKVVQEALEQEGFRYKIHDMTAPPRLSYYPKDMEISGWFRDHEIDFRNYSFAILDDLPMSEIPELSKYHVQTTYDSNIIDESGNVYTPGFTDQQVKDTIQLLKRKL